QDQKPDQDQKIASKLAPTGSLESITYFVFDKSGRPVFDAALSRSKQDSEYLQHPPIGSLSFGRGLG
ncbi:MAG: hypothetical protein ACTIOG_03750, partial [Pseudomonas helleri]|uniref:hypothetical protein n=1 Tax=Pseudomonas helleri TaxID=1608996 RepID=UPI003F983621